MARALVEAGTNGLWVNDHVVIQEEPITGYPYSADGRITWNPRDDYFEALNTCAYLAGAIDGDVTIGTAVLVLPQRHVLQTAKELATIDQLSGGRLRVGIGAGWNAPEMEALGHPFDTRGARLDEMLTVLRDAWSGRTSGFDGKTMTIPPGLLLSPRPTDPAGPPLIVGGMTAPALRRAAVAGDGWMGLAFVDKWDHGELETRLRRYRDTFAAAGRDGRPLAILKLHCTEAAVAELAGCVDQAAELGFDEVIVELPWGHGVDEVQHLLSSLVSR
jgi:probable F420-dependent oxidoreductase